MSDTLRTDAAWATWLANGCPQRLKQESEKLERELTAAQAELKNNKELHDRLLNEYAHVDTEVRKLALSAGIPQDVIDGDSYSVPGIEELVELIVQILIAAQAENARLTRERNEARAERDRLRDWKESAMAVEREWDANAIATILGGIPGESQRTVIAREVPRLLERVKRLEDVGDALWDAIQFDGCTIPDRARLANNWRKAKEATP